MERLLYLIVSLLSQHQHSIDLANLHSSISWQKTKVHQTDE